MTLFVVDWDTSAEMQLAAIWLHAPDPKAVTQASARIDEVLAQDPAKNGRALSEGLFKLEVKPLTVYFTIDLTAVACGAQFGRSAITSWTNHCTGCDP